MPASRSLIALLVGTVAFFALWLVALKPGGSSSSKSGSSQGLGQYQSDLNAAHHAVGTSNASNAASGNDGTPSSSSSSASGGTAAASKASASTPTTTGSSTKPGASSATKAKPAPHLRANVGAHNQATLARLSTVQKALNAHKMVVMLFYNPQAADDQAVKQELSGISTHHGRVVKVIIPLSEAANFTPVTQQVPVNFSPTLVLIGPEGDTNEIVGYSDPFEIAQRVDDGLAQR